MSIDQKYFCVGIGGMRIAGMHKTKTAPNRYLHTREMRAGGVKPRDQWPLRIVSLNV